jgi:hypothetical protein
MKRFILLITIVLLTPASIIMSNEDRYISLSKVYMNNMLSCNIENLMKQSSIPFAMDRKKIIDNMSALRAELLNMKPCKRPLKFDANRFTYRINNKSVNFHCKGLKNITMITVNIEDEEVHICINNENKKVVGISD